MILFIIGIMAYHKKSIQYLFLKACQDIEQTGFGRGIGNTLVEAFSPLMDTQGEIIPVSSVV